MSHATRAGHRATAARRSRSSDYPDLPLHRLEERTRARADAAWERLGHSEQRRRDPERELPPPAAGHARRRARRGPRRRATQGTHDDEVLRDVLNTLDAEESTLDRLVAKGDRRSTGSFARAAGP